MSFRIAAVDPAHIPHLARICFDAFGSLQDRHGVERDFDSLDSANMVVGMFATRPDFAGFMALEDGRPIGSNFISFSDPVAGIGPITIDPASQSRGVGRALMLAVMDEARRRGVDRVRLQQEAINTASLSLYTKLGFEWREACTLIQLAPAPADATGIRPLTERDLDEVERLSVLHYHASRRNEVAGFLRIGLPGFVLQAAPSAPNKLLGYCFPSMLGHGFAQTPLQLATLLTHTARYAPPPYLKALIPLSQHDLHVALLRCGCRSIKLFNYMTTGPFERPAGAWFPSIGN